MVPPDLGRHMPRTVLVIAAALLVAAAGVWLNNTSVLHRPSPGVSPKVLAHRGVYQTFPTESLDNDSCTATLIAPPTHPFLENTIASMRAAFASGADIVELRLRRTSISLGHVRPCRRPEDPS